jgi:hypothetical protein
MGYDVSATLTWAMGGEGLRVGDTDDFPGRFAATMTAGALATIAVCVDNEQLSVGRDAEANLASLGPGVQARRL